MGLVVELDAAEIALGQLIAVQRLDLRRAHQLLQKAAHDLVFEDLLAVFSECVRVPDRIVGAQVNKLPVQQVVVELVRRNLGSPFCGVERANGGIELIDDLIRQYPDPL